LGILNRRRREVKGSRSNQLTPVGHNEEKRAFSESFDTPVAWASCRSAQRRESSALVAARPTTASGLTSGEVDPPQPDLRSITETTAAVIRRAPLDW